jgi:hypothetical protein
MEHKGARRLADRPNLRFRLHTSNLITVCAHFLLQVQMCHSDGMLRTIIAVFVAERSLCADAPLHALAVQVQFAACPANMRFHGMLPRFRTAHRCCLPYHFSSRLVAWNRTQRYWPTRTLMVEHDKALQKETGANANDGTGRWYLYLHDWLVTHHRCSLPKHNWDVS